MSECDAPDCSNNATRLDGYCSNVCMNVHLAVAGERLSQDDITEPVPDERIKEIRESRKKSHEKFAEELADADPDA